VVKNFRPYFIGATIVAYVPSAAIKDIFTQQEVTGRRCRWINRIQELNINVQITKLVKRQGLAKLMVETNLEANQANNLDVVNVSPVCDMQTVG